MRPRFGRVLADFRFLAKIAKPVRSIAGYASLPRTRSCKRDFSRIFLFFLFLFHFSFFFSFLSFHSRCRLIWTLYTNRRRAKRTASSSRAKRARSFRRLGLPLATFGQKWSKASAPGPAKFDRGLEFPVIFGWSRGHQLWPLGGHFWPKMTIFGHFSGQLSRAKLAQARQ